MLIGLLFHVKQTSPSAGQSVRREARHDRHCERSEAIQNPSAEAVWIASSQELLAMTGLKAGLAIIIAVRETTQVPGEFPSLEEHHPRVSRETGA